MRKKIDALESILRDLEQNCDIDGAAIVTERGQTVASSLPQNTEEKAVSAMAAAMLSIGNRVGDALDAGAPKSILIDGENNSVILRGLGRILLIGIAPPDAEIGLIGFELNQAAKKLQIHFSR